MKIDLTYEQCVHLIDVLFTTTLRFEKNFLESKDEEEKKFWLDKAAECKQISLAINKGCRDEKVQSVWKEHERVVGPEGNF